MASCHKRGNKWYVVVSVKDEKTGKYDSEWMPFEEETEARQVCKDISKEEKERRANKRELNSITKATRTVENLIWDYINITGVTRWSPTTFTNNLARAENYIIPHIGNTRLIDCNVLFMDKYFAMLKNLDAVHQRGKAIKPISSKTCMEVHKFLKAMFNQAMEWEMIDNNPCRKKNSSLAEYIGGKPPFWTIEQFRDSTEKIFAYKKHELLGALFLSVSTSMREGEVCGLQWKRCYIGREELAQDNCRVEVDRELYRVRKDVMKKQNYKDIIHVFPDMFGSNVTSIVLKTPKSKSSIRTIWLPETSALMLRKLRSAQDRQKELLGSDYRDNDLVFARPDGRPIEGAVLNDWLQEMIQTCGLPPVTYHSTRHTSTTYKLLLTKGDIKCVQGDTGHAQAKMITDVYARIRDLDRKNNAVEFEKAYFQGVDFLQKYLSDERDSVDSHESQDAISQEELAILLAVAKKNPDAFRQVVSSLQQV